MAAGEDPTWGVPGGEKTIDLRRKVRGTATERKSPVKARIQKHRLKKSQIEAGTTTKAGRGAKNQGRSVKGGGKGRRRLSGGMDGT